MPVTYSGHPRVATLIKRRGRKLDMLHTGRSSMNLLFFSNVKGSPFMVVEYVLHCPLVGITWTVGSTNQKDPPFHLGLSRNNRCGSIGVTDMKFSVL